MYKKTNNYFEQESGRSMVEMLGVLAIIGVLSVGGISGYTTAMNKHKANEILNAAAVRAMAVSTQLQNGAETPTLAEFPNNEEVGGAKFSNTVSVSDDGKQFTIGFSTKPSDAVLAQMENIIGDKSIVQDIDDTDGGLTYNKDLGTGDGEAGETATPSACPSGTQQSDGTCSDNSCTDNTNCLTGEYCKVDGNRSSEGNDCVYTVTAGTCASVGSYDTKNGYTFGTSETMTWDAAHNWCIAVGKIKGKTLKLADKAKIDAIDGENCNANAGDCAVYQKLGRHGSYWLDALEGDNKSCLSYFVDVLDDEEGIYFGPRNAPIGYGVYYALCE